MKELIIKSREFIIGFLSPIIALLLTVVLFPQNKSFFLNVFNLMVVYNCIFLCVFILTRKLKTIKDTLFSLLKTIVTAIFSSFITTFTPFISNWAESRISYLDGPPSIVLGHITEILEINTITISAIIIIYLNVIIIWKILNFKKDCNEK
jgi:cytochrome c biogenesis factor